MAEGGVVFKIDLEKAYDHVDWNFVDYTLIHFVLVLIGEDGWGNASQPLLSLFWSTDLHLTCLKLLEDYVWGSSLTLHLHYGGRGFGCSSC